MTTVADIEKRLWAGRVADAVLAIGLTLLTILVFLLLLPTVELPATTITGNGTCVLNSFAVLQGGRVNTRQLPGLSCPASLSFNGME